MALFKSGVVAAASGSMGGVTFSHNAGGMYIRARTIPTNPNTGFQAAVRAIVAALSNHWLNTLTAVQREAWETYAGNVELTNPLGDPITVSGLNMYIRSNTPRQQFGGARIDTAPVIFNLGDVSAPWYTAAAATDDASVNFTVGDDWVGEDASYLAVYASRPQNPSINYFKGPYRLAGYIEGDSVAPPASPQVLSLPFPVELTQRIFFKAAVSRADGRLSTALRQFCTAT